MIYKTLHRKLEQHEPHWKPGVNSGAPEVPAEVYPHQYIMSLFYSSSIFRWEDHNSQNMIIAFIGLIMFVLLIVYVWKCCKCDEEDRPSTGYPPPTQQRQQIPIVPCYAHELEPGLVVLQSQDGEYFRILQEYDSTKLPKPPMGATGSTSQPLQYIPQFTRAHFQTHMQPSAPVSEQTQLIDLGTPERPPPYYTAPLQH